MKVRSVSLSSVFLVFAEVAGFLASSAEPAGAGSRCGEASSAQAVETTGAVRLEVDPVFQPFVDKMCQASPTFRGQSRRLAAGTGLSVSVLVEDLQRPAASRARTVLRYQNGSLVSAQVYLKPSLDAPELIAHELEHILEQLDGVDLRAQAGSGVVWKSTDGTFETRRAIETGRRVARELTMGSDVSEVRGRRAESSADRLTTVVQQDGNAAPSSVRSARVNGSGRYVVFVSSARLVEADHNQFGDIYVLDLATGRCTLESVGPGGSPGNGESLSPDISWDGRYVVFESAAGNLTDRPLPPGIFGVFLRDREKGATRLLTVNAGGEPANGTSGNAVISADGTVVVFESTATDLLSSGDAAHGSAGIYLVQLPSGVITRLDLPSAGGLRDGHGMSPAVSADGRFVAFVSKADLTCRDASACVT